MKKIEFDIFGKRITIKRVPKKRIKKEAPRQQTLFEEK